MLVPTGTMISGKYRIERELSSGGMGSVYLATDVVLDRPYAVKLLHAKLVREEKIRALFLREAQASSYIRSEHVVQVHGYGVDPTLMMPYLVMELLNGQTLAAHIETKGRLSNSESLKIADELCHAVGKAHHASGRKIVHRDLKPENIFLHKRGDRSNNAVVKVLDFGIASWLHETETGRPNTMQAGTMFWMAPEQLVAGRKITPATDVWAIGLILFKMLTGLDYWKSSPGPAWLREIELDPIVAPSIRAKEIGCNVALPENFDEWFLKCVNRDPGQRYKDGNSAFLPLRGILGDAGYEPLPRDIQTSRAPYIAALVSLLVIVIGGVLASVAYLRSPNPLTLRETIEQSNPFASVSGVSGLEIQEHEVTRSEYKAFWGSRDKAKFAPAAKWPDESATIPATFVTWEQATRFCEAIHARLPTAEEWTAVARVGWPNSHGVPPNLASVGIDIPKAISPLPIKASRGDVVDGRIYDIIGNVLEWTSTTESGLAIVRGASFKTDRVSAAKMLSTKALMPTEAALDGGVPLGQRSAPDLGFRCARQHDDAD